MKKILLTIMAVSAVLTGCKKENISSKEGTGRLSISMDADSGMNENIVGPAIKSADQTISLDEFKVRIAGKDGIYSGEWKYSEMPSVLELRSGEYTVTASSPEENIVAWEHPVYGASKDFSIVAGSVSTLELVCRMVNMKVSVNCSEKFLAELSDFDITVSNEYGDLVWNREEVSEGKSGFFPVGKLNVYVKGYRAVNGETATMAVVISDVAASDHHILNLDARTTGEAGFSLSVDPTLNDKEQDIDVPGFEEVPVPGGDPEEPAGELSLSWPANPSFDRTPITDPMDVNLKVTAESGIRTFVVTVDSDALEPVISEMTSDGSPRMDLINDEKLIATLGGLLPAGDDIKGKESVDFPLSTLVPMILPLWAEPGSEHIFTLEVSDSEGQTLEQSLTFYVPEA